MKTMLFQLGTFFALVVGTIGCTGVLSDKVTWIDSATNQIVGTWAILPHDAQSPSIGARGIATGDGSIWVTSAESNLVWRVDPRPSSAVQETPVPAALTAHQVLAKIDVSKFDKKAVRVQY